MQSLLIIHPNDFFGHPIFEFSGVARLLVLAGHLLYASLLAPRSCALRARLCDMSGTNMALWPGTCPPRPALRYATV